MTTFRDLLTVARQRAEPEPAPGLQLNRPAATAWRNPEAAKIPDPMPELADDVEIAIGVSCGDGKPGEWKRVIHHTQHQTELTLDGGDA